MRGGLRAGQRWDAVRAAPLVPDNAGRREGATREGAGGSTWDVQVTAGVLSDLSGVKTQLKPIKNLIISAAPVNAFKGIKSKRSLAFTTRH